MIKALQYGAALLLLTALVALGGCGAVREQARMALDDYESGLDALAASAASAEEPSLDEPSLPEPTVEPPAVAFRGRQEGAVYFNDLADLVFAPPVGWSSSLGEAASVQAPAFNQAQADFFSRDPDTGPSIAILFKEATGQPDDEEYWEAELAALQEAGYAESSLEEASLSTYSYHAATWETPEGFRRVYMRRVDGYTLSIVLTAQTAAELDGLDICFA